MKYESPISYHSKYMAKKVGQTSRSNSKKIVPIESSCHNTHVKYESPITYHLKDIANVKVFADKQTDRPKTICPRSFDTGA
jgi:hypothetical protein